MLHWSGGKDSALALQRLLYNKAYDVDALVASVDEETNRVTMHGVRMELIERQAEYIGLPLTTLRLPQYPDADEYRKRFRDCMESHRDQGFTCSAFGDIFLNDLRTYREKLHEGTGLKAIFPLWKEDTGSLAKKFISDGFKALAVCVDAEKPGKSFTGLEFNGSFLDGLPETVDPCGENGEFHTFVYDGPIFRERVLIQQGKRVYREYPDPSESGDSGERGFWFTDLLPGQ